jgi:integrase
VDRGVRLEAVSKALRHKHTSTTEQYYGRLRGDDAFRELEEAFNTPIRIRRKE